MTPCKVRPHRRPQRRTWRSVRKPPSRHAMPPKKSGPPEASTSLTPERWRSLRKNGVIQEIKNDQPALLQKYIRLNDQRVGLRSMVDQESGKRFAVTARPPAIKARSASLTRESCCGLSR